LRFGAKKRGSHFTESAPERATWLIRARSPNESPQRTHPPLAAPVAVQQCLYMKGNNPLPARDYIVLTRRPGLGFVGGRGSYLGRSYDF
jgi:hypothetical protein